MNFDKFMEFGKILWSLFAKKLTTDPQSASQSRYSGMLF